MTAVTITGIAALFAKYLEANADTVRFDGPAYDEAAARMNEAEQQMLALTPTTPNELAMQVIANTYDGGFGVQPALLTAVRRLAGLPAEGLGHARDEEAGE